MTTKNSAGPTKVKKEMGVQMQEFTENCKNKEAFVKTSESESTLTKTIKENYLLKRENKKLQERIAVLDSAMTAQQDNDKENENPREKPKKTKTSHYNNKHQRQSAYFETKNPFELFTHETSYDYESEDEINFRRKSPSKSTRSRPKYIRSKTSHKQRNFRGNTERYGNNSKDFSRGRGKTNKLNVNTDNHKRSSGKIFKIGDS